MSRKTIAFKFPGAEAGPGAGAPAGADPASADDAETDRWIRARDLGAPDTRADGPLAPAAPGLAAPAPPGATIDICADRTLGEVVALSLALPPALGWFWAVNTFDRYRRLFAA